MQPSVPKYKKTQNGHEIRSIHLYLHLHIHLSYPLAHYQHAHSNMRFTTLALPFALAGYCSAWTKDANGVWVANHVAYNIDGSKSIYLRITNIKDVLIEFIVSVEEACTTMNTKRYRTSGWCEFWADAHGRKIQSGMYRQHIWGVCVLMRRLECRWYGAGNVMVVCYPR